MSAPPDARPGGCGGVAVLVGTPFIAALLLAAPWLPGPELLRWHLLLFAGLGAFSLAAWLLMLRGLLTGRAGRALGVPSTLLAAVGTGLMGVALLDAALGPAPEAGSTGGRIALVAGGALLLAIPVGIVVRVALIGMRRVAGGADGAVPGAGARSSPLGRRDGPERVEPSAGFDQPADSVLHADPVPSTEPAPSAGRTPRARGPSPGHPPDGAGRRPPTSAPGCCSRVPTNGRASSSSTSASRRSTCSTPTAGPCRRGSRGSCATRATRASSSPNRPTAPNRRGTGSSCSSAGATPRMRRWPRSSCRPPTPRYGRSTGGRVGCGRRARAGRTTGGPEPGGRG
ncbi:MAG: hypothetical protein GXX90_00390 [Microbacteriaceae bacterium]|nr:hypothetical protein [Microbacteriaceae bacterium]